nr:immunoglobulin heavy chain junction region [Mus musculus]MBK4187049.1 immunoglobulin heavy chain junction region [Mus musculus]MBK4187053.1 immunoglobulin heavy chain junction region [Mus musculus]MBK4187054.1 immunoglobulin heavy chain junction region [Mus musculus]MBK4187055.1 immunoglobulin heavy chain junction region [Mus musculus]
CARFLYYYGSGYAMDYW